jgi:hypothetical protein
MISFGLSQPTFVRKTPCHVDDSAVSSKRVGWKGRWAKYTKEVMPYRSASVCLW